jgi:hypothetical protein
MSYLESQECALLERGAGMSGGGRLDLRVEVEEGFDAVAELGLDLLAATFEDVHGDLGLIAILEDDGCGLDCFDFIGGEEPHSIDEY